MVRVMVHVFDPPPCLFYMSKRAAPYRTEIGGRVSLFDKHFSLKDVKKSFEWLLLMVPPEFSTQRSHQPSIYYGRCTQWVLPKYI
jgi:hypothetical protein